MSVDLLSATDIVLLEQLSSGSFGDTYTATLRGELVCVKCRSALSEETLQATFEQINRLHSNIVEYLGMVRRSPEELWLVMEYCDGGLVCDLGRLDEAALGAVLASALDGMNFLHSKGIEHGDMRASNLMLAGDVVKLAGYLDNIVPAGETRGTLVGTPFWLAPEKLAFYSSGGARGYDTAKADLWSLGITAIELGEGAPPHGDMHPLQAIMWLGSADSARRLTFQQPELWSAECADFLALCLKMDPAERATGVQLHRHPFVLAGREAAERGLQPLLRARRAEGPGSSAAAAAPGTGASAPTEPCASELYMRAHRATIEGAMSSAVESLARSRTAEDGGGLDEALRSCMERSFSDAVEAACEAQAGDPVGFIAGFLRGQHPMRRRRRRRRCT